MTAAVQHLAGAADETGCTRSMNATEPKVIRPAGRITNFHTDAPGCEGAVPRC